MRIYSLTLTVFLIFPIFLNSQTQFQLISSSTTLSRDTSQQFKEKYDTAIKIYNRLIEARGDRRFPPPVFKFDPNQKFGAYFESDGLSIGLEEKAYDICMSFGKKEGKNALATLLGHELIHFYEKHQWRSGFIKENEELSVARELDKILGLDKINNETQADYLGGFLAYSAGYPVFENMPAFYDRLYSREQGYNLPDTMAGYANKEDRKALAQKSVDKVKELVDVFELANLLTVVGKYGSASALYKYVLLDYQAPEIYNNLGVRTVLEALTYFSESEKKYRLPLELDLTFGTGSKGDGFAQKDSIRKSLLQEAITYFDNATSLNSGYAPAYLNKACAYLLLDDEKRARFYANVEARQAAKANPKKYRETLFNVRVLLALAELRNDSIEKAKKFLDPYKGQVFGC